MNKFIFSITFIVFIMSSCCEKDVFKELEVADKIIGVYESDISFFFVHHYKIKIVKLEDKKVRIVPFIGNEMRPFTANFSSEKKNQKIIFRAETGEYINFDISTDPIEIDFKIGQRFLGHKIE